MNQVFLKGIAARDARAGMGRTGAWWVCDVTPEGESASYPVWHFGDAPAPAKGDTVEAAGRLSWNKDRDGNWAVRVVAADVAVTPRKRSGNGPGNGGNGGPRVGAGPRRNSGGGVPRQRPQNDDESVDPSIPF